MTITQTTWFQCKGSTAATAVAVQRSQWIWLSFLLLLQLSFFSIAESAGSSSSASPPPSPYSRRPQQQQQQPWGDGDDEQEEYYEDRWEPRVPAPKMPPPPPPPPSSSLSQQQQQPPPPMRQQQQQHPLQQQQFSHQNSNSNNQDSYTPIDYAFPSKDLVNQQKQQTTKPSTEQQEKTPQKKSLFGFGKGGNKKQQQQQDEKDNLGAIPFSMDEPPPKQAQDDEDWFDISKGANKNDNRQRTRDDGDPATDRPWVDADLRPATDDYASARRDPVARYMAQSALHRVTVYIWASAVGAGLGGYIGQSLVGQGPALALFLGLVFGLLAAWARNPYGEWTRAAGLACWMTLQKSRRLRHDYPTGRHLRALLGIGPRHRFPPGTDNPWQYRADASHGDPAFDMTSALACMVIVGSMAGGTIPMLPSWMGALGGAGALAVLTTRKDARGDWCRTAGMRVRLFLGLGWSTVVDDLELPRLTGTVTRKVLDKILILDRQHKLQDKLMGVMAWGFGLFQKTVQQARGERVVDDEEEEKDRRGGRRGPPPRDEEDDSRRRGRQDQPPRDAARPRQRPEDEYDDDRRDSRRRPRDRDDGPRRGRPRDSQDWQQRRGNGDGRYSDRDRRP